MKASQAAKQAGLKSLSYVSEMTGVSSQTLNNWCNNKPKLFRAVIDGITYQKGIKHINAEQAKKNQDQP